ncbi:GNAT family N-acetyltransferase [Modestobacter altitudinis]|uniref:GNAT family N-acetyltransferase n=1 Tax=Modestobacter altitudinis TaxID=2213158 RepID=UPI0014874130|nr:GNAT family N-acetyltransferase [Modestobacter altitudinis]
MSDPVVRPFRRADRDQLTALVNAHVCAVVPGWAVSVAVLLSQLERDPGQYVTDPWVVARATLVAEVDGRLVAAAHLRRYGTGSTVAADWRDAGEIAWLVCWPAHEAAGGRLAAACVRLLDSWDVRRQYADGDLPTAATYGVPDSWPHVARVFGSAGFDPAGGRTEVVLAGTLDGVRRPVRPTLPGLTVHRTVGTFGARSNAVLDGEVVGFVEAQDDHTRGGTLHRMDGWADLAELHVDADRRGQGIGTWLVEHLAEWLRLGGTRRFLVALGEEDLALEPWFGRFGWHRIGTTRRSWVRQTGRPG